MFGKPKETCDAGHIYHWHWADYRGGIIAKILPGDDRRCPYAIAPGERPDDPYHPEGGRHPLPVAKLLLKSNFSRPRRLLLTNSP